jgi:flagellar biosynthetic protein FlhB
MEIARGCFELRREDIFATDFMADRLVDSIHWSLLALVPVFIALTLATLLSPVALGGWMFSVKPMMPKFERLDPIAGLQRMFSVRSLVELLKAIAKVLVVGGAALLLLWSLRGDVIAMAQEPLESAIHHASYLVLWSALALSASTLLIAAVDVPFQLFDHAGKLRMTMQQVRDELKESEGRPEVKSRIRQLQREMAKARMMSAVPKADVVITNPTHYAVALRYDVERAGAPLMVAKGADLVAFRIREIAQANGVPVVSSPRLARAIFHTTELDQEVPAALYLAVAQVLAYVFHLRNWRRMGGKAPQMPGEFDIPEGMDEPRKR